MDRSASSEKGDANAFPDSEVPGNTGQSGAALAESQARLKKPGLVADGNEENSKASRKKRKDDLEVTIAPGLESTSDIALGPPR